MEKLTFTLEEKEETLTLYQQVRDYIIDSLQKGDEEHMRHHLMNAIENHQVNRNVFGLNPILLSFQTALLVVEEIGLRRDAVIAILLRPSVEEGYLTIDDVQADYGESVARILRGLQRIQQLYKKNPVIEGWDCILCFSGNPCGEVQRKMRYLVSGGDIIRFAFR